MSLVASECVDEDFLRREVAAVFEVFDREALAEVATSELKSLFYALGVKVSSRRFVAVEKATLTFEEVFSLVAGILRARPPIDRSDDVLDLFADDTGLVNVRAMQRCAENDLGVPHLRSLAATTKKCDLLRILGQQDFLEA